MHAVESSGDVVFVGIFSKQLIGRSRELAFLTERARDAARRGGIVVVRGEAGIGKTRLLTDFAAAGAANGFMAVAATAREFANAPYAVFAEVFAELGGALPSTPSDRGEDAKAAWFEGIAEQLARLVTRPTAIVFDDLQWSDAASLHLLRYCADRLAAAPLLFVASYRSDDVEADTVLARALAAIERDVDVVPLNALAPGQVEHLLAGLLAQVGVRVPPDIVAEIRDLADGRPLYAEELLRGVLERLERDGRAELAVPPSVRAAVRERYAALDSGARNVLVHAAVFGRRFSAEAVAQLLDLRVEAVYTTLRRARDLQLIVEVDGDDDDRFAFRHALTREAIYGEMLRAETRSVHGRVAALLAALPNPVSAEIAEHAWRARDSAAAHWNERAADEAAGVFAYVSAARHYERAFRTSDEAPVRVRAAHRGAESWYALGELERAATWYAQAADAAAASEHGPLAGRLRLRRARVLFEAGRYDEGLAAADALAHDSAQAYAVRAEAHTIAAGLLSLRGRAPEALARLQGIDIDSAELDAAVTSRIASTLAQAYGMLNRPAEARAAFDRAFAEASAQGDRDLLSRIYHNRGRLEIAFGPLPTARNVYDDALALAERENHLRAIVWLTVNRALVALLEGELQRAGEVVARADEAAAEVPLMRDLTLAIRLRLATLTGAEDNELAAIAKRTFTTLNGDADEHPWPLRQLLGAALAFSFAAAHEPDEAGRLTRLAGTRLEEGDVPYWIFDAVSRFGDRAQREEGLRRLREIAPTDGACGARGYLSLMMCRESQRARLREEATAHAEAAVAAFRQAGWRLDEAFALEAAGRTADALALFRETGALGEVRRLTQIGSAERRRGDATLTGRERDIARLVVGGLTAKAMADTLVISERTVESHVASIYRKLGVANRRELAALFEEAPPP